MTYNAIDGQILSDNIEKVLTGQIATDKINKVLTGQIVTNDNKKVLKGQLTTDDKQKILKGEITADSVIMTKPKWGDIKGDINNQDDLINMLNEKEDNQVKRMSSFFNEHPEYEFRFFQSIANKPLSEVNDYVQLVLDDKFQNGEFWLPYEVGKMALIVKCNASNLSELIRFYLPDSGQIGTVDASGEFIKFLFKYIGDDEDNSAEWGKILGSIENQTDLIEALNLKLNRSDIITKEDIDRIFGN